MLKLVLDIETTKIETNRKEDLDIVAVGILHVGSGEYIYNWNNLKEREDVKALLKDFDGLVIGHNLMFDVGVLRVNDCPIPKATFYDTMIALRCINIEESKFSLKSWATYLGYPPYWKEFEEMLEYIPTDKMPWDKLEYYNKIDLEVTKDLFDYTENRLGKSGNSVAFDLEMEILPLAERMETAGIPVDHDILEEHLERLTSESEIIEDSIAEEYGPINLNSPFQVAKLLYDDIGLEEIPDKGRSTAEPVLSRLRHRTVKKLMARRKLAKLKTAYVIPMSAMAIDNILYSDVRLHGTESGRFSFKKPALQTIPEKLRDVFYPINGSFVSVDLDQLEFKLIADLAGEDYLIRELKNGRDVHEATASSMFGVSEVTKEQRSIAKTINYTKLFGAGIRRIMETSGLSWKKSKEFSDSFELTLPTIMAFISWVHREVVSTGKIDSPFGRRREFMVDLDVAPNWMKQAVCREAVDFIIQSMGHDLLSLLWLEIERRMPQTLYRLELHDELVMDVHEEDVEDIVKEVQLAVDTIPELCYDRFGYRLEVPITATIKSGHKWR